MQFYFVYILLGCLLFTACKKPQESENWTEVHVNATNFNTGEPLTDIYIGILEEKQKSLALFETETEVLSEGFTDSEGQYYFGWKAKNNSKYSYQYIAQADPNKYYAVDFLQFYHIQKGETYNFQINLIPRSHLHFIYENQNCFNETDSMWFKIDHVSIQYQSEDWNPFARVGCYYYDDPNLYSAPTGDYEVTMMIKRNGSITYDTVYVTLLEGQTTTVELFY